MSCPAMMLGTAPPIRDFPPRFAETRYNGFELKEQSGDRPNPFLPLQTAHEIHILNVHVVR
jgi:hypothetical protein